MRTAQSPFSSVFHLHERHLRESTISLAFPHLFLCYQRRHRALYLSILNTLEGSVCQGDSKIISLTATSLLHYTRSWPTLWDYHTCEHIAFRSGPMSKSSSPVKPKRSLISVSWAYSLHCITRLSPRVLSLGSLVYSLCHDLCNTQRQASKAIFPMAIVKYTTAIPVPGT